MDNYGYDSKFSYISSEAKNISYLDQNEGLKRKKISESQEQLLMPRRSKLRGIGRIDFSTGNLILNSSLQTMNMQNASQEPRMNTENQLPSLVKSLKRMNEDNYSQGSNVAQDNVGLIKTLCNNISSMNDQNENRNYKGLQKLNYNERGENLSDSDGSHNYKRLAPISIK